MRSRPLGTVSWRPVAASRAPEVLSDLAPNVAGLEELIDAEKAVLAFEHRRWTYPGAKDEAILKTFTLTPVHYQQWVLAIIDKPAALVHDPMLVKRLRRLRATRRQRRAS
jgi:hypothetical protein